MKEANKTQKNISKNCFMLKIVNAKSIITIQIEQYEKTCTYNKFKHFPLFYVSLYFNIVNSMHLFPIALYAKVRTSGINKYVLLYNKTTYLTRIIICTFYKQLNSTYSTHYLAKRSPISKYKILFL